MLKQIKRVARAVRSLFRPPHRNSELSERWRRVTGSFPKNPGSTNTGILIWRGPAAIKASLSIELIVAAALRQRGVPTDILACDDVMSGTIRREITDEVAPKQWPEHSRQEANRGRHVAERAGFNLNWAEDWLDAPERGHLREIAQQADLANVGRVTHEELRAGQHAMHSMHRYLRGEPLDLSTASMRTAVREYLFSAMVCGRVADKILDRWEPDRLLMQHGFYAEWGPAYEAARKRNIPVVRWGRGYNKDQLRMSLSDSGDEKYVRHASPSHRNRVRETSLTASQKTEIDSVLEERRSNQHQEFSRSQSSTIERLRAVEKPIWGLFAHLSWDAVIFIEENAFENVKEWVLRSVERMKQIEEVQWVVKVHPAEALTNTQHGVWHVLQDSYSKLPDHIDVLPPDTEVNTYDLLEVINGGITIRSTIGLEMACRGGPVLLAGGAHYGEKGFTLDAKTKETYYDYLERVHEVEPLRPDQVQRAKRYAYDYFVNRHLPFGPASEKGQELHFSSFDDLRPGNFEMLDRICKAIVSGKDFTRGVFQETSGIKS